jgi:hypothetical protein
VIKPGAKLVVANITSMRTASEGMWLRDEDGDKLAWRVEFYSEERGIVSEWQNMTILNYHRPLANYFRAFLDAGFILEDFQEPVPDEAFLLRYPHFEDFHKCPNFNLFVWRKPAE